MTPSNGNSTKVSVKENIMLRIERMILPSFVVALAMGLAAPLALVAQEPLRWKFEKGQKFDYNMVQEMTIGSKGGPQGDQNVTMKQEMEMTWDVQDVQPDGNAVIHQKLDRMKMKMTLPPPAGAIEYDTGSNAQPVGPAAVFAPLYKAMTQKAFIITMTPRGEISDVVIPDEVTAAFKNMPGMGQMGEMGTAEGFKKLISQGSLVLPKDPPKPGENWTIKVEVNNPAAGKQVVETNYRYEDTKEIDGVAYAVLRPSITLNFEGAPVKITGQTSDGEILFNVAEGRLDSTNLKQQMTLEQPGGGQMTIGQNVDVKMKPAGEAESEAPSTENQQPPDTQK
jgi:hypothetical protein